MYKILKKRDLNESNVLMEIEAPRVVKKALPGQFVILRVDENGERIPLTIAGVDHETGGVRVIFQKVGYSTTLLGEKNEGDYICDFAGPLGKPTDFEDFKKSSW